MPIYSMKPEGNPRPTLEETDPEKLATLLQIELMQKRARWQQAKARRTSYRTMSFLFLFFVIVAAFLAFYFLMSTDRGPMPRDHAQPAAFPG